jgi:hypothetical protein
LSPNDVQILLPTQQSPDHIPIEVLVRQVGKHAPISSEIRPGMLIMLKRDAGGYDATEMPGARPKSCVMRSH